MKLVDMNATFDPNTQALPSMSARAKNAEKEGKDLHKVSAEFESLFLNLVLKSMRSTVKNAGFIDGGNAEKMYRSLLDSEYAKIMSETSFSGISEAIYRQLSKVDSTKAIDQYQKSKETQWK